MRPSRRSKLRHVPARDFIQAFERRDLGLAIVVALGVLERLALAALHEVELSLATAASRRTSLAAPSSCCFGGVVFASVVQCFRALEQLVPAAASGAAA